MAVRRRGRDTYQVRVYIGFIKGERQYDTVTVHGTEEEANLVDAKLKVKYGRGASAADNPTVAEFLDRWLHDYIKPFRRPKTYQNYEMYVRLRLKPALGATRLKRLTASSIQMMYRNMKKERLGGTKKGAEPEPVSDSTIHGCHRVLRAALQQAVAEGLIDENPAAKCKPPRPAKFQPVILDDAEVDRFLAVAEGHRLYALFEMALRTGMRMGELLGLKWRDIDWANKAAHVDRTLQDLHGPIARELGLDPMHIADYAKSDDSIRPMLLPDSTIAALRKHRARQNEEKLRYGSKYQDQDLVFANRWGGLLNPRNATRRTVKQICKSAGLDPARFHDLRHTHFQGLADEGVSPRGIADRAGHADPAFAMRVYTHRSIAGQKKAVEILNAKSSRKTRQN